MWEDNWIPKPRSLRSDEVGNATGVFLVKDLILDNRVWNAPLIRELFSPQDTDSILQIQFPESHEHDRLAWFFDRKGLFTVYNAYHLELDYRFNISPHSCASSSEIGGVCKFGLLEPWSLLWALEVPNKIKHWL